MTDGTRQDERFPAALEDGYFHADDTPFEDLVAMSAGLAARLRFFDLHQRQQGTWREMFASDESLVMARIVAMDRDALQSAFLRDFDAAAPQRLAQQVVRLADMLDLWLKSLAANTTPAATLLRERIEQLVAGQLGGELHAVIARYANGHADGRGIARTKARLAHVWTQSAAPPSSRPERDELRTRFFSLLSAIERVQVLARELLPQTLHTETHEPAVGLLMAFLQLYATVQRRINRFTERHVDFYYHDCLGLEPGGAAADAMHLACRRDLRATRELLIPRGMAFAAGKDAAGRPIEFRADEDLLVTDARVAALLTLRLERDPLISPEREFGYVTRAKGARIDLSAPGPWPLFGGSAAAAEDARIGLAVATPLLHLKEGEREIRLTLRLRTAGGEASDEALVDSVAGASTREAFVEGLGRLFSRWVLADSDWLGDDALQRIRQGAQLRLGEAQAPSGIGDPLCLVHPGARPARDLVFDQLFNGLFDVGLTVAGGWLAAEQAHVRRAPGGLQFAIRLRSEDEPVVGCDPAVHGAEWPTRLPVLRLQLRSQARVYPYSLLAGLHLAEAEASVAVSGLRDVVLHNQLGRLDPSKPFNPFGPLPNLSSYLVFGAPEIARKNLRRLTLHTEWGGLPADAGGFGAYYRGYGGDYRNAAFTAAVSILRDGQWQTCAGTSARQPLFAGLDPSGHLRPAAAIEVDAGSVRKHCRATTDALAFDLGARNGFFRLQLTGPPGTFGHQAYPMLLAEVVTANAKSRRPAPLPNPPYTPVIERFTLDYEAHSTLRLVREAGAEAEIDAERMLRLHPFGIEDLRADAAGALHPLLPPVEDDGNLCIGVAASELQGALSLLFHLRDESAVESFARGGARPAVRWACLVSNRWHPLPASRVLSDTTGGFLTSGIVTLDLPAGIGRDNTVLPGGLYWLRVSAGSGFDAFAGLYGVQAQALRTTRVVGEGTEAALAALAAGTTVQPAASLAGLAGVVQVGASFGLRGAEDERLLRTRAGERLQHKNRASTAWDFERLVLARFPGVFMVKCFFAQEAGLAPGRVLVVVVPAVSRNDPAGATLAPRMNAIELRRIAEFLRGVASPFATVDVRNAAYERILVRCTARLARGTHAGTALRRIDRAIVETLSPWHDGGNQPRFDWIVRCEDIEACLRGLDGVESVGKLSLLHVARSDDGVYTLGDTARRPAADRPASAAEIAQAGHVRPRAPWSIALPMATHLVATDEATDGAPEATGVSQLAIGATFIVGGGAR
ncbi:hypothetical protein [Piscinibacter sp.]|uniref:hypothetical protein n=1 Tax=Piscinibacter sp. TaxID=1903157 RepID=UPI002C1C4766|nr:hypothetical protein [Albitalea sp.]HUG26164.1 hypothetical protein [Albitalea sp.]